MFYYMNAQMTAALSQGSTLGIIYGAVGKITSILLAIFVLLQAKKKIRLRGVLVGFPYAFIAIVILSIGSALIALAIAGNSIGWFLTCGVLGFILVSYTVKALLADLCYATKELFIIK